jgi:hypothetical protein
MPSTETVTLTFTSEEHAALICALVLASTIYANPSTVIATLETVSPAAAKVARAHLAAR